MAGGSQRGERIAALLVCLAFGVAASSCGDGYPRDDLGLDNPTIGVSAAEIVARLNRMNRTSLTGTQWRFTLTEPCLLRLRGRRLDGSADIVMLQLLHGDIQVKGNIGGPVQAVQIEFSGTPALGGQNLFEAERWTDAVEYATHLQALQRTCATRPANTEAGLQREAGS